MAAQWEAFETAKREFTAMVGEQEKAMRLAIDAQWKARLEDEKRREREHFAHDKQVHHLLFFYSISCLFHNLCCRSALPHTTV